MYNSNESCICKKIFNGENKTEASYEHSLADYFPKIKRVLNVACDARLTGVYINGEKIEYDGVISCSVMYQAEDKSLQCADVKFDFSDYINIKNENAKTADVVVKLENCALRVLDPRKISLKARINACINAWGDEYLTVQNEGVTLCEDEKQISTVQVQSAQISVSEEMGIGASEDIAIPSEYPEAERIITVYVFPQITELTPQTNSIVFKATVTGIVVYQTVPNENGESGVAFLPISVGLSNIFSQEGINEECTCSARMSVYDITTSVSENTEGEKRVIELDFLYDVRTTCACNESVSAFSDMYSTAHRTEAEYQNLVTECACGTVRGNFTVSADIPPEVFEGINGDVLLTLGNVVNCKAIPTGRKIECRGDADITFVCQNGEELSSVKYTVPFKGEFDNPSDENAKVLLNCSCGEIKTRFDGDGYSVTTEVFADISVSTDKIQTVLKSVNAFDKEVSASPAPFVLYYPSKKETAWNIAKKYGISVEALKKANNNNIENARAVVIPKKAL